MKKLYFCTSKNTFYDSKNCYPFKRRHVVASFWQGPASEVFNVEDGQIKDSTVLQAPEHRHGAMPRFLAEQHCTDVICGGIGGGAVELLNQLGIRIHGGAPEMQVTEVIKLFLNGTLTFGDSSCHHHCEGHHHE